LRLSLLRAFDKALAFGQAMLNRFPELPLALAAPRTRPGPSDRMPRERFQRPRRRRLLAAILFDASLRRESGPDISDLTTESRRMLLRLPSA